MYRDQTTVFVLPEWLTKNKEARVVVETMLHNASSTGPFEARIRPYVFTGWIARVRHRFARLNNPGWKAGGVGRQPGTERSWGGLREDSACSGADHAEFTRDVLRLVA